MVIPSQYRKALGLRPGDEVLLTLKDNELRVISRHQALARAQALVRKYVPKNISLSEELIRERREEMARD